jgi:hypothetical protein
VTEKEPEKIEKIGDEDNMSLSEIISRRFKKFIHIQQIKTPNDVAKFVIQKPDTVNKLQDFQGSPEQQTQL